MLSFIFATAAASPPPGGFGQLFIPMALMMVIFYFLLIRPQRKKQKELDSMIEALKSGDRVVTAGGLHGLVTSVKDTTVLVRIAEGVKVEFDKTSISRAQSKAQAAEAEAAKETEEGGDAEETAEITDKKHYKK